MTTDQYLAEALTEAFRKLNVGDVLDPETDVPVVTESYWTLM